MVKAFSDRLRSSDLCTCLCEAMEIARQEGLAVDPSLQYESNCTLKKRYKTEASAGQVNGHLKAVDAVNNVSSTRVCQWDHDFGPGRSTVAPAFRYCSLNGRQ